MTWVVHCHDPKVGYMGYLYVRTREQGRRICRFMGFLGMSAFVTRPDGWNK